MCDVPSGKGLWSALIQTVEYGTEKELLEAYAEVHLSELSTGAKLWWKMVLLYKADAPLRILEKAGDYNAEDMPVFDEMLQLAKKMFPKMKELQKSRRTAIERKGDQRLWELKMEEAKKEKAVEQAVLSLDRHRQGVN